MESFEILRLDAPSKRLHTPAFAPDGRALYYAIANSMILMRHAIPERRPATRVTVVDHVDEAFNLSELLGGTCARSGVVRSRIGLVRCDPKRRVLLVSIDQLVFSEDQFVGSVKDEQEMEPEWITSDVFEIGLDLDEELARYRVAANQLAQPRDMVAIDLAPTGSAELPFYILKANDRITEFDYHLVGRRSKREAWFGSLNFDRSTKAVAFDTSTNRVLIGGTKGIVSFEHDDSDSASAVLSERAGNIAALAIGTGVMRHVVALEFGTNDMKVFLNDLESAGKYALPMSSAAVAPLQELAYSEEQMLVAVTGVNGTIEMFRFPRGPLVVRGVAAMVGRERGRLVAGSVTIALVGLVTMAMAEYSDVLFSVMQYM